MTAVGIAGLLADVTPLAPGEALIERIFATTRAALDQASVAFEDVDSVVLAADDVADGDRSPRCCTPPRRARTARTRCA